jgi:hypothetical protein
MSEGEVGLRAERAAGNIVPLTRPIEPDIAFDRRELTAILNVYGRYVAAGEWRDYALQFSKEKAVFAVFRRSAESPLYRIEKNPRLAAKQGAFSVVATGGLIVKRGPDLARVLRVFDKPLALVT